MATGTATKIKKKKKSVLKRIRLTAQRAEVNRANRTQVRTMIKQLRAALASKNGDEAQKLLSPTMSSIDQGIRKGVLKENTGNRYKSRLRLAYNALRAGK